MYNDNFGAKTGKGFPNPLAPLKKRPRWLWMKYAKAIENQWGSVDDGNSLFKKRYDTFKKNRKYANGTQDTPSTRSF